ncbi:OB-fold nucleic acid binding domain-containing protein [Kitasatospora sp. NPDC001664]
MTITQTVVTAPAPTRLSIADLRTSGRAEGQVRLAGTITQARLHTNRAGNEWATLTLTDTTGQIDLNVFPRTWMPLRGQEFVQPGQAVAVTGRINTRSRDQVEIYCHDLAPTRPQALPPQAADPVSVQTLIGRYAMALADIAGSDEPRPVRTPAAFTALVRDAAHLLAGSRLGEAGGHLLAASQYLRAVPATPDEHQRRLLEFAAGHLAQAQDLTDWPRAEAS